MFKKSPEERLSAWSNFRKQLDHDTAPLSTICEFWSGAPLVPYYSKMDPYNPNSWPTPWELIYENKYDDFTLAVMMAYSLKLSKRFSNDKIEVRSFVDNSKKQLYNLVYINEEDVLNYAPNTPKKTHEVGDNLYLENIVEIFFPR